MLWYSRLLGQDPLCPTPLPTWHPCSGCSGSESTSTAKESRCHVTKQHDCAKGWQRNSPGLHQTAVLVCKSSDTALFPRSKHRALEVRPGSQASPDLSLAEQASSYRMDGAITLQKHLATPGFLF